MCLEAFFSGTKVRGPHGAQGIIEKREGKMVLVGSSGLIYTTLEAFFAEECKTIGTEPEDPWDVCEFWKSWAWWKCKEMLPPTSIELHT